MKKISIVIPTYNEEENIGLIYQRLLEIFSQKLQNYTYEILFIDNKSNDASCSIIRDLCEKDYNVKAIFNATNFGFSRSSFYGLTQATGDAAVLIFADMQDPPEMIPEFVSYWDNEEKPYKIVVGIKNRSKENRIIYWMRSIYYKLLKSMSYGKHINQFDGFGLYDASFVEVMRNLDDNYPYLRGIVSELGYERKEIKYCQGERKRGKSKFKLSQLYDLAMLGLTSSTRVLMRGATIMGMGVSAASLLVAFITFIRKLLYWDTYPVGTAAMIIGIFFLGAVQLFFIGILGEYILNINIRTMRHPVVVEEERINLEIKAVEKK